ncbi:hypothetical protein M9H77_13173 [Catharanthus roseus]|uniref:Uncharacterized protein n=1 Tax=Catharanthus roseus TaxID=4058 RepID=A0ACC0BJK5_CATRO|nr:hypothetical protein M9H77_13173 [Catharanthus roseus]
MTFIHSYRHKIQNVDESVYQSKCGGTIIQKFLPLIVLLVSYLCWVSGGKAERRKNKKSRPYPLATPRRRMKRGLTVSLAKSLSILFGLPLDSLLFSGRVLLVELLLKSIRGKVTENRFP